MASLRSDVPTGPDGLTGLLAAPSCAAIRPALRAVLHDAIEAGDIGILRDPPEVLADTLSALATLDAEGDVLVAAILRFSTLDAICAALSCQPGDLLEFVPDAAEDERPQARSAARTSNRS